MSRSLSNTITQALAVIGFLIATLLTVQHFMPQVKLPCSKFGGCQGALSSKYGKVGPIPTAALGAGMYAVIFGLCRARRRQLSELRQEETARARAYATSAAATETEGEAGTASAESAPVRDSDTTLPIRSQISRLDMSLWGIALLGTGISLWLQYVSLFQVLSFCPYCLASALMITLIFVLASRDYLLDGRTLTGEQKMLGALLAFIFVLFGFIFVPNILGQIRYVTTPRFTTEDVTASMKRDRIVGGDLNFKGDPKAPYTLVKFADYQCPSCKEAVKDVDEILKSDPRIRFAFRNFPLSISSHLWARPAAEAAEAARNQGKFWEMHDAIYEHQEDMKRPNFSVEQFADYAAKLGMDRQTFLKDMSSEKTKKRVEADLADGEYGGVSGTPTFFFASSKSVWRLGGVQELKKALANPDHPMWK